MTTAFDACVCGVKASGCATFALAARNVSPHKRHALLRANICSMQETLVAQAQLACLRTRLLVSCCACACVCAWGLCARGSEPPIGPLCCQTRVSPSASFFLENF